MKKYKVNVNGTAYEIEIELVSEAEVKAEAPKTEAAPVAEAVVPQTSGEGEAVAAPMPGTILSVNVKAGDTVKSGQVLFILEAMKMENEIMAGCDGTVTAVSVSAGQAVESGTPLCTIK